MTILKSKTSRLNLPVLVLCLFLLAIIWASYFRQRAFDKEDSIRFAIERNSNLAVALEQYTIRTLHNADAILQVVKMEYADKGKSLDLQKLLKSISINHAIDDCVSITGPDGQVTKSNAGYAENGLPDFSQSPCFIFSFAKPGGFPVYQ